MSVTTTCYACGALTPLKCMNPNCLHYFCRAHGDFICADCHLQTHQQQAVAVQHKETQQKVVGGIVAVLVAILIGFLTLCWEIIKAIFQSI